MSIFTNRRNIRVNRANLMRLVARGIIDRRNVNKSGTHITFPSIPFAYARRINSICDLDVYTNDTWNFVRNMDYSKLEEFYKDEVKKEKPKRDGLIIVHDEIKPEPKVEIRQVEEPDENINEEVQDEFPNDVSEEAEPEVREFDQQAEEEQNEEVYNSSAEGGSVEELEYQLRDATEEEQESVNSYIESISNDVASESNNFYDYLPEEKEEKVEEPAIEESTPDEPILESSGNEESVKEDIEKLDSNNTDDTEKESQNNHRDLNSYNFNKPTFKKRKRK